ncbi:MAG: hypothetical protein RIR96_952, partial [Bacteroidota bacterium]
LSASDAIFGSAGTILIALLIMISTFGCNNGLILAGARVYYTMAKDQLFFKNAGTLNENAVPEWALWIQCAMACALCLSGKYGDLLDMVSFVVVIFYVLTIAGIFILRVKQPHAERPYKAFGYPFLPIIYIIMGLSFCILLIIYKPQFTWPGLTITLIGIPLYYFAVGDKNKIIQNKLQYIFYSLSAILALSNLGGIIQGFGSLLLWILMIIFFLIGLFLSKKNKK